MRYRRATAPGATYIFAVDLDERRSDLLVRHIDHLRSVMRKMKQAHPLFMVVSPEHLHAVWRLPPGDTDHPLPWSQIKAGFSRHLPPGEDIRESRKARRERGIWQRRYWEHQIRDETDLAPHVDCIHYNPAKHGLVRRPLDWPHSTLHAYIERGLVTPDWGVAPDTESGGFGEP